MANENLKKEFINLIRRYGEDNELELFGLCSAYGVELAHSTIDKIVRTADDDVLFYYNENTGDYDSFNLFKESDLAFFLNDLKTYAWNWFGLTDIQKDMVMCRIEDKFGNIFSDSRDLSEFCNPFLDEVVSDIQETADWGAYEPNEINLDDVDIAIARELKALLDK